MTTGLRHLGSPHHPQSRIRLGDGMHDVDTGIAPLICALWSLGIETTASGQGWATLGEDAYVAVSTEQDWKSLESIVQSASTVLRAESPDVEVKAKKADPDYAADVAAKGGGYLVAFPPDDIDAVLRETLRRLWH